MKNLKLLRHCKYTLSLLLILSLFSTQAFAITNTESLDLESASNQYLYIADASQTGLDLAGDFSVEAWIKPEHLPTSAETLGIAGKYLATGNQRSWSVYIPGNTDGGKPANRLEVGVSFDGTATNMDALITTNPIITTEDLGKWMHIAVAYDISARSIEVYKNGEAVSTTFRAKNGTGSSIYNNSRQFEIGRHNEDNVSEFDGQIDEVRVWSDIRTSTEVSDNMLSGLSGSESNLVGYWSLNGTSTDTSTNVNHLVTSGSPSYSDEPAHILSCTLNSSPSIGSLNELVSCLFGWF